MSNVLPFGIERRLERLEAKRRAPKRTWDELNIEFLQLAWRVVAEYGDCPNLDPKSAAIVERCREHIAETEASIIRQATKRQFPPDAVHAENYRRDADSWWATHGTEYVPPLLARDDDWDAPNIMQRRAALREMPEIAALLKQAIYREEATSWPLGE